jgi:hypothetical protein
MPPPQTSPLDQAKEVLEKVTTVVGPYVSKALFGMGMDGQQLPFIGFAMAVVLIRLLPLTLVRCGNGRFPTILL